MLRLRNGVEISQELLNAYEVRGFSESAIADELGITRMGLYKVRRKAGWPQAVRSDKGIDRKPLSEKKEGWAYYMREYRKCHPKKFTRRNHYKRNKICKKLLGYVPGREVHLHHYGDLDDWDRLVICDPVYHKFLHKRMLDQAVGEL
jgi:hypothetical protein